MNIKATALKLATLGALAAAFVVASPAKADAQVSFGVRVGGPVYPYGHARPYYAPPAYGGYYGGGYYGGGYYGGGYYGHPPYGHPYAGWHHEHFYGRGYYR